MSDDKKKTSLEEIGEFGLIEELTKNFKNKNKSTLYGVGDDAAVIEKDAENVTLVATDALLEGVHFNLMYTPLMHLGYKAVVVNLSDIYAMNGTAEQITVTIAASSRFPKEALEELYKGIEKACELY